MVRVQGLTEVVLIKQGLLPSQQYVVEVLRALCPEVASIKNLTVHAEATGGTFVPDEMYVITRLILRKGRNFDIARNTTFQQYTDKQGQHGWLVYVYEDAVRPPAPVTPSATPASPQPETPKPHEGKPEKYCPFCGAGMRLEAVYCPRCGKKQVEEKPAAPPTAPVSPQPETPKSEWEKRYRFLSLDFHKRSECPFMDSSGACVSPAASTVVSPCTCSRGYRFCHVYPIHTEQLGIWKTEYEDRMRIEEGMKGTVGECRICGNNRKLDEEHMCSVCILAAKRANEVFEERKSDSLICDWCMKDVKKGQAFLPAIRDYFCCANCWRTIYAKY
jgi:hypothetical protein